MTDAFMHQLRTQVGPQRFISGSVCPSKPFERELSFASPSKRAAESQNFWRLSNTDAPVCVHRWAVSPALRSRSSEREKKLSNRPAAPTVHSGKNFQNFGQAEHTHFCSKLHRTKAELIRKLLSYPEIVK